MDRYGGRTHGTEGSQADPAAEWSSPGGETGLEEPVWQLEISGGVESYPERPDEADCIYYLRTGFCGYGPRCRFNHPRDRGSAVGIIRASGRDYPERVDQPVCQYYMRTGMCKFGSSCKYHHPKQGVGTVNQVLLNVYGYPLRPGEKECSYYMKTMQCKFGATCKFHHPQPAGIEMVAPGHLPAPAIYQAVQPPVESSQQYGMVSGNWPVARPAMLPGSYVPGAYGAMMLPPGMVSIPGWSSYPAPVGLVASPGTQPTVGAGPMYGITQLSSSAPAFTGPYISTPSPSGPSGSGQKEHSFPQRPGEPECQFYMKTGDCKFGSSCKYHHPPGLVSAKGYLALSPIGLPLRPGAELCSHYAQSGVCKFGPSCKFDHPMGGTTTLRYSPSASSLTDMPVTPYPIGSSIAIMAPSSSSANLRPELRITASAPFGSTFSKNNGSTSIGHKGEISKTP